MKQPAAEPAGSGKLPTGIRVSLSPDNMSAFLSLLAGFEGALADVLEALAGKHILHGLDNDAIEDAIRQAANGQEVSALKIARGEPPIDAEEGRIELHYKEAKAALDPGSRASVNLREVDRYSVVKKDQLLAELIPSRQGKGGRDVLGKVIPPHHPRASTVRLIPGANVRRDDDNKFYAETDGVVEYERGAISVKSDLNIAGDIDYSTGNIRFPGPVRVRGSVTSGFVLEAAGDIQIGGDIQDARVTSFGNITVSQGIVGEGKSVALAKGRITAGWIEQSAVESGEDVIVGSHIFNSRVNADGWVKVVRGKGTIVGGEVWAAKGIEVRTIGSESVRGTVVAIGGGLALNKQIAELNELTLKCDQIIQKIKLGLGDKLFAALMQQPDYLEKLPGPKRETVRLLLAQYKKADSERTSAQDRRNDLVKIVRDGFNGEIKALSKVYPGSIISIGRLSHEIKTEVDRAVFSGNFNEGDIVINPF